MPNDAFLARRRLATQAGEMTIFGLTALEQAGLTQLDRLPFSIRLLLESVLRQVDEQRIRSQDVQAVAAWAPGLIDRPEIPFLPARVLMQDFTGVPAVVDLAAMRAALARLGAIRAGSTRASRSTWSSITRCRSTSSPRARRCVATPISSSSATRNAIVFSAGGRRPSPTSASSHRPPGSSTRSTSSIWRRSSSIARPPTGRWLSPIRSSAPIPIRRWSTAWASSAGESVESRPKPRCSASRW